MKKKNEINKEISAIANEEIGQTVSIDVGKCYQFNPEDFEIDVTSIHYANNSFIQIAGQDVFVDFIELPGVKKEGKMVANSTRIYMTHVQAKKLADTLGNMLDKSYKAGRLETYPPSK